MNLLRETRTALAASGLSPEDVHWVEYGTGGWYRESKDRFRCTWAEFAAAANFEYDEGYGGQEVRADLMIVGKDWWLERGEYDGAEWWEFKRRPAKPEQHQAPDISHLRRGRHA